MIKKIALLMAFAGSLWSQQVDGSVSFSFTGSGNSFVMDNRTRQCVQWGLTYTATGFTALSLTFQSAPDSNGSPGAWVTFAGTLVSGSNPSTVITQASSQYTGYFPWLRVNLAGLTGSGSVTGGFSCRRFSSSSTASISGAVQVEGRAADGAAATGNPVLTGGLDGAGNAQSIMVTTDGNLRPKLATSSVVTADATANTQPGIQGDDAANTNPVFRTFPFGFNGSTWDREFTCNTRAAITLTASGNTQIIAATASQVIRICHLSIASASAIDIKVTEGTGANCATGTADVTGLWRNVVNLDLQFGREAALRSSTSQAICINQSGAVNSGGVVIYTVY